MTSAKRNPASAPTQADRLSWLMSEDFANAAADHFAGARRDAVAMLKGKGIVPVGRKKPAQDRP